MKKQRLLQLIQILRRTKTTEMLKLQFLCSFSLPITTIEKLKTALYYSPLSCLQSILSTLTTTEFANLFIYILFSKEILDGKGALLVENCQNYCDIVGMYLGEHPEEVSEELRRELNEEEKIQMPFVDYVIPKQRKKKVKQENRAKKEQKVQIKVINNNNNENKKKEEKIQLKVISNPNTNLNNEKEETTDTTTTTTSLKPADFDQNCVFEFPNLSKTESTVKQPKKQKEVEFKEDFPRMMISEPPVPPLKKQKIKIGKNWEIDNVNPLLNKNVTEEFPSLITNNNNNNNNKSKEQSPVKSKEQSPIKKEKEQSPVQSSLQQKKEEESPAFIDGYFDTNNRWVSLNQNDIIWQLERQEQFREHKEQAIGKVGKGKNKKVLLKGGFV